MSTPPDPLPTHVYKILDAPPPDPLPEALPATPLDASDGFIHLSSGEQVPETARLYFAQLNKLWVLELPLDQLEDGSGTVKWEGPRGCAHLYGVSIGIRDVSRVIVAERGEDQNWPDILKDHGLN